MRREQELDFVTSIKGAAKQMPEIFLREKAGESGLIIGLIGIIEKRTRPTGELKSLLQSAGMDSLIRENKVTVGMIKPRLDQYLDIVRAQIAMAGDAELAQYMQGRIVQKGFEPLLAVSFQMSPNMVKDFYREPMQKMKSITMKDGRSQWDHFNDLMASGPVTFLVLYNENGRARESWREAMGTTWNVDVVKATQPDALRALALSNVNNLLHGSDSLESVSREISFIAKNL